MSKQQQTWLPWCGCGRVVELTAGWLDALLEAGWCGAAAWWWKLEADAGLVLLPGGGNWKLVLILVLLSGGGSWKLMLIWCSCLVVKAGSWCWLVLLTGGGSWGWFAADGGCLDVWGLSRDHWGVLICWFCCCCLVVEAESWGWFFAFAQIWLETVAPMLHKSSKIGLFLSNLELKPMSISWKKCNSQDTSPNLTIVYGESGKSAGFG